ncbi:MAG TPA: universal stress protein [Chthonomonadaceae bacterium]|nr:universal stress protein [Chthonomonadaceae bacterium]
MAETMKLLIGYDGSPCGDAALRDLRRAGLPAAAEALILSVADVFLPVAPSVSAQSAEAVERESAKQAHGAAQQALAEARERAETARQTVQSAFSGWSVRAEARADSPAWAIILRADRWKPDLIVVGSHGHSTLGRLVFGSVSHTVVTQARGSVRVARGQEKPDDAPIRLIIGCDGSTDADLAVRAVAKRAWPSGTEARVLAVRDSALCTAVAARLTPRPAADEAREAEAEEEDEAAIVQNMVEAAAEPLRMAGLSVEAVVREGDPKQVLIAEAEAWGADCLFVGARGLRGLERLLLGSVSAAVAMRAHCSVEVVRAAE